MIENEIKERNLNHSEEKRGKFIDYFNCWEEVGEYIFENNFIENLFLTKYKLSKLAKSINYARFAIEFVEDYYDYDVINKEKIELYSLNSCDNLENYEE